MNQDIEINFQEDLKPGSLRINDLTFYIPPEAIGISSVEYDSTSFMLRESLATTLKTGRKRVTLNLSLVIDLDSPLMGYDLVSKFLMQVRKTPLATIENEKIRKEILGEDSLSIAGIPILIDAVTGSIDNESPSLLRLNVSGTWFNHFPYAPFLLYSGDVEKNEAPINKTPTSLFQEFYRHDVSSGDTLINYPDPLRFNGNNMEIFYKEYKNFKEAVSEVKDFKKSNLNKKDLTSVKPVKALLEAKGWINSSEKWNQGSPDTVFYRWKKIEIPISLLGSNGNLLLEDIGFSLMTNIAYIPMEGYSVPTAQFMGGSVSQIRSILFSGPDVDADNRPTGTSSELSKLQKVLDAISENRVKFSRHSKEDYILIKHPIAKLLKYEKYVPGKYSINDSFYYDEEISSIVPFDYNDLLPVVVASKTSRTIEGLPFSSRLQIDMKETRLRKEDEMVSVDKGPPIAQRWLNILSKIEKTYEIKPVKRDRGSIFIVNSNKRTAERDIASRLSLMMNNTSSLDESATDVSSMFKGKNFNRSTSNLASSLRREKTKNNISNQKEVDFNLISYGFVNKEGISVLVSDLMKLASRDPDKSWSKKYDEDFAEIIEQKRVSQSQTYKDVKIPLNRQSPTYYFSETDQSERFRREALSGVLRMNEDVDNAIKENLTNKEASLKIGKEALPSAGGVSDAMNIATIEGQEKKHGALHKPSDAEHRAALLGLSMKEMTPVTSSISKAYPAFKVYLKRDGIFGADLSLSDLSTRKKQEIRDGYRDISESFDVSSILDIRIVKDENVPGDLLILRVISSHKDIVNRDDRTRLRDSLRDSVLNYDSIMELVTARRKSGEVTKEEEAFAREGIREGSRIQARLGYSTDPNNLDTEFNGRIVSVSGSDIVEIVCLGNGVELVQDVKGLGKTDEYSWNSNTPRLINELLKDSPEIASFGTLTYQTDSGLDIPLFPDFLGGSTILDNIFAPSLFNSYTDITSKAIDGASLGFSVGGTAVALSSGLVAAGVITAAAPLLATLGVGLAAGAVIFGAAEAYKGVKRWLFGSTFTVYNKTVWEILNELTLRHPGTIVSVVPYDDRSTIFFGEPNEYYFHRGPNVFESGVIDNSGFTNKTAREYLDNDIYGFSGVKLFGDQAEANTLERAEKRRKTKRETKKDKELNKKDVVMNLQKPFRTYHLISSEHDIICNKIEVTSKDVGNSIQIRYPEESEDGNFDGSKGFSNYKITDKIQADDDIYPEYINNKIFTFENAHKETVEDMPERYAKSILAKELSRCYKGKIVILGRSKIKPHDVCIIRDTYNDIYGPIGVSKVVHVVSPTGGWVTEITPKMMVFPDTSSGIFQLSNIIKGANYWLGAEYDHFYTNMGNWTSMSQEISDQETDLLINDGAREVHVDFHDKNNLENLSGEISLKEDKRILKAIEYSGAGVSALASEKAADIGVDVGGKLISNAGKEGKAILNSVPGGLVRGAVNINEAISNSGKSFKSGINLLKTSPKEALTKALAASGKAVGKGALVTGKGVLKVGKVPLMAAGGTVLSAAGGVVAHLILDSMIDGFINWSKYRQPIAFYPLTRQRKPWYGGMNGFRNNTIIQHLESEINETVNRLKYSWAIVENIMDNFKRD